MDGFDYLKAANEFYNPRTPSSALRAVRSGLLPVHAYVYKAGSVKPLNESPYDLDEIERVLSREDNDIHTYLQLNSIFTELLEDQDPEIALYAAESINIIENRYNREIERLKEQPDTERNYRRLARLYYDLALFNHDKKAIRSFYLREAFSCTREVDAAGDADAEDKELTVRILQKLELFSQADYVIKTMAGERDDAWVMLLEAENAFLRKDFQTAIEIIMRLRQHRGRLNAVESKLFDFWSMKTDGGVGTDSDSGTTSTAGIAPPPVITHDEETG